MKLAIIGSRTFTDYAALDLAIKQFFCDATMDGYIPRFNEIISGGAAGADSLGAQWGLQQ